MLQPNKEQLIQELDDLILKIDKLGEFFRSEESQSLEYDYQCLLSQQLKSMRLYADILNKRIFSIYKTIIHSI